jgi:hypothetical protein
MALLEFFLEASADQKNDCQQDDLLAEMERSGIDDKREAPNLRNY